MKLLMKPSSFISTYRQQTVQAGNTANIANPYYILKHYKALQGGRELKQISLVNDGFQRAKYRSPSAELCRMKGEQQRASKKRELINHLEEFSVK